MALRADAQHLLTDVWTSAGVLAGVLLVKLTGWLILDPVVALLVAANIVWTGVRILQETGHGLLDRAIADDEQAALAGLLERFHERGVTAALPGSWVTTHLEPLEDPASWDDRGLDRRT